jgi:hypothetical protein
VTILRHFGRIAFFAAVSSWAVLGLTLVMGGISPDPSRLGLLKNMAMGSMLSAVAASALAIVALVRGPQRGSAACGLALGLLYLLAFTGAGFGLLR